MTFTFEDLNTAVGAGAVSVLAMFLVQLLKVVIPDLFNKITGALVAFIITGVVYAIGAIVLSPMDANGYLGLFLSWAMSAGLAVGIHSTATYGLSVTKSIPTDPVSPPDAG